MTARWKDIRRGLPAESEARLQSRVGAEINKLPLAQVRKARAMTQERLAEILQVNQAAVSKLEQRADMYMSTLRSYIEAMGGSLEIHAVFPEGEILLDHPGSEGERQLTSRKAEAIAKGERRQRKTA